MNDNKSDKPDDKDGDKILISFYIPPKTFEKIDDILFYVKKSLPIKKRRRVTKSAFYEAGLHALIDDYNAKGEEGILFQAIQELMQK